MGNICFSENGLPGISSSAIHLCLVTCYQQRFVRWMCYWLALCSCMQDSWICSNICVHCTFIVSMIVLSLYCFKTYGRLSYFWMLACKRDDFHSKGKQCVIWAFLCVGKGSCKPACKHMEIQTPALSDVPIAWIYRVFMLPFSVAYIKISCTEGLNSRGSRESAVTLEYIIH